MKNNVIENARADLNKLKQKCNSLQTFEVPEEEENLQQQVLALKAFRQIVNDTSQNIESSTKEQIEEFFKAFYHLNLEPYDTIKVSEKISSIQSNYLDRSDMPNTKLFKSLKSCSNNSEIILQMLYNEMNKERDKFSLLSFLTKERKVKSYLALIEEYEAFYNEVLDITEKYSKHLSKMIIDNFYTIYTFISYMIKIGQYYRDLTVVVEIASLIDAFIDVMIPSLHNRDLGDKDLLYHNVITEFKRLKFEIVPES
jgi:hypothetical protein